MSYESHLYLVLMPNQALVASQLTPEQFAKHFNTGSARHYAGKTIFAEIDIAFRHPYFDIDAGLAALIPHEDGRPKATKYISTYRVLEHIDFETIKALYLTTPEGYCIELTEAPHQAKHEPGFIRTYAEIAPPRMLVLSRLDFPEFGQRITEAGYTKGAPKLFYTQIDFNTDEFLKRFDENPMISSPVPGVHPSKLRDAILELRNIPEKPLKAVSLDSALDTIGYRLVRHGFMFASSEGTKYFPMLPTAEIERRNYQFYRSM